MSRNARTISPPHGPFYGRAARGYRAASAGRRGPLSRLSVHLRALPDAWRRASLGVFAKHLCRGKPEVNRINRLDRRASSPGLFSGLATLLTRRLFLALLSPGELFLTLLELSIRSTSQKEPSFGTRVPLPALHPVPGAAARRTWLLLLEVKTRRAPDRKGENPGKATVDSQPDTGLLLTLYFSTSTLFARSVARRLTGFVVDQKGVHEGVEIAVEDAIDVARLQLAP